MKHALIFWGGWPGHQPEAGAAAVAAMLRAAGLDVRVEEGTAALADPAIRSLDLIVPVCTMMTAQKAEIENLCAAVEAGVGFGGCHHMADAFRNSTSTSSWSAASGSPIPATSSTTRVQITTRTTR